MSTSRTLTEAQSVYLDFLRALAAWAVLLGHASMIFSQYTLLEELNLASIAVLVFFLLSGFLISLSVVQKWADRRYDFGSYLIDRFCRIFCAYIPALILVLVADYYLLGFFVIPDPTVSPQLQTWMTDLPDRVDIRSFFGNLLMLQDYPVFQVLSRIHMPLGEAYIRPLGSAPQLWTISIEWWFYVLFGLACYIGLRKEPLRWWYWPLGALALPVVLYNLIAGYNNCLSLIWLLGMSLCFVFCKTPGSWFMQQTHPVQKIWVLLTGTFAVLLLGRLAAIYIDSGKFAVAEFQFSFYLAGLVFSIFFLLGHGHTVPKRLKQAIVFFANYSFSLYLVHHTVLLLMQQSLREYHQDPRLYWAAILISNLVAIIFWWLFERHYRTAARYLKSLK